MKENIWDRYGPYPKKRGKKRVIRKEGKFLKKSFSWFTWKAEKIGGVTLYHPCLQH